VVRSLKNKLSNLRDGVFGLAESAIGYLSGFVSFLVVLAGFAVLWGLWRGVTTVEFTNESAAAVEGVTVTARSLEGEEEPLWNLRLPAGGGTYRFAFACCDYIVVKYRFRSFAYELLCRHPDWDDFPEYSVVIQVDGAPYCRYPRPTSEPPCTRIDLNAESGARKTTC
jgi:hypothetical protein